MSWINRDSVLGVLVFLSVGSAGIGSAEPVVQEAVGWANEASGLIAELTGEAEEAQLDAYDSVWLWRDLMVAQGRLGDAEGLEVTAARLRGLREVMGEDERGWLASVESSGWAGAERWERAEALAAKATGVDQWEAWSELAYYRGRSGDAAGLEAGMARVYAALRAAAGGVGDVDEFDVDFGWYYAVSSHAWGGSAAATASAWEASRGLGDPVTQRGVDAVLAWAFAESDGLGHAERARRLATRMQAEIDALTAKEQAGEVEDFDPDFPESELLRLDLIGAYAALGDVAAMDRELRLLGGATCCWTG
ncbi:MAG: hypothetical protein AAF797_12205 [Planctomycetota bacterium]